MPAKLKMLHPNDLSLGDYEALANETSCLVKKYFETGNTEPNHVPNERQEDLIYQIGETWLDAFTKIVMEAP